MTRRPAALLTRVYRFFAIGWRGLFGRLDFQEKIVGPVVVNLLTGFVVFVILAVAKDTIYPLVLPRPSVENYPIHVSAEAYRLPDGLVHGEIYIANLTRESLSGDGLREWLEQHKGINPRPVDDQIVVRWRRPDGAMTLTNAEEFNAGKGKLELVPFDNGRTWRIRVADINRAALLRVDVMTTYAAPASRADVFGMPFEIDSPRRN